MKGFIGILAVAYLFHCADAAIVFTGPGTIGGTSPDVTGAASVAETSTAGDIIFAFDATEGTTPTYVFATGGNPDSVAVIDGKNVKLATSKSIDYETTKSLVFKITGNDAGNVAVTLTVTLTVTNRLEFAKTSYEVCVAEGTVAATVVGTYTVADAVTGTETVAYTNTPVTDLIVVSSTGALMVVTGKTLTSATAGGYTTTITATATGTGASAIGTTVVKVTVGGCSRAGQIHFMAILLLIPLLITRLF
ncbi:uncharacterized protein LOC127847785 [Dreissena polymorpha]|uniref:Cadherin domain-containing protein n=1 Tax=Dreissena polymorpha TaxID=45954 RepID=A0A9D4ICY9_DREPO|nr:uncharacterized protein LOC127847785 [Dreissena polymorpha]KAH3755562.1 hypothetical protein DPMN_190259 [Dreissena polymorpha]